MQQVGIRRYCAIVGCISMSDVGQPTQNGYAERVMRTLKEEHVDYSEYRDIVDARVQIGQWPEVEYTRERIHSSLAYVTPAEFEAAFWQRPAADPS